MNCNRPPITTTMLFMLASLCLFTLMTSAIASGKIAPGVKAAIHGLVEALNQQFKIG